MKNNIEQYRKKIGLTQSQLSELCGWEKSQTRISNYEKEVRTPSVDDMRSLVQAFVSAGTNCTLDDLFPPEEKTTAA